MTITRDTRQIVLVGDSDEDHDAVREAVRLSGLPASLRRVSNGDECLALLRRASTERPAFVMMDLNTFSTDGREALRQIKADPLLKVIPVVVVTTSANPRDVDYCYQCGGQRPPHQADQLPRPPADADGAARLLAGQRSQAHCTVGVSA